MTIKQKRNLIRIIISAIIYSILLALEFTKALENMHLNIWIEYALFLIPYILVGYDILLKAARNITKGQIFDENFLMVIATFGAFGIGELSEAVAVMLFYQVGELFQSYAVGKSRQSISDMMNICPEFANVEKDGKVISLDPDEVEVGTIILVRSGEKIPLDGIVVEGQTSLDTSALTGESMPRRVEAGQEVISGCINIGDNPLRIKTSKEFEESTVARILELVENAATKKAKVENFITRFAKYYTPIVTTLAILLAFIPPLFLGNYIENLPQWVHRACVFLVISCPCALVISVPMGFFGGIGAASKNGILVKGSNYLEIISKIDSLVFDKTGTLTKGEFNVSQIICNEGITKEDFLEIGAHAEIYSTHPIANSIKKAYKKEIFGNLVSDIKEHSGKGLEVFYKGNKYFVGNEKLMKEFSIKYEKNDSPQTVVYIADEAKCLGSIIICDTIKEGVKDSLAAIKKTGLGRIIMLTGDNAGIAEAVADDLGIDEFHAELLPDEKVEKVEKIINESKTYVAFVGDGINDAPVISRADVGIAMGSLGSDAAIEAADIVLMDDDIKGIEKIIKIAKRTLRIVKENIVFALGVKFLVLLLGALGLANMWAAVFADVGVSVIAILNSMRTLKKQ